MKKLLFALSATLIALASTVGIVLAAPLPYKTEAVGPYEGVFSGYVYGDRGSRAPIKLEMIHRRGTVTGTVNLGEGLYVDGGRCGGAYIPASVQSAGGETLSTDPNRLQAGTTFSVSGFQISAELDSLISPEGENLIAQGRIDLPWLCGRDPVLNVELIKVQ